MSQSFVKVASGEPIVLAPRYTSYVEVNGLKDVLQNMSREERRRYISASVKLPYVRKGRKIGRNDPCLCGSGLKFKKCCIGNQS